MKAKKNLGQNFLNNEAICNNIVSLLCPENEDLIIEIGPGKGILTKKLKNLGTNIICIEIDEDLKPYLSPLEDNKCKIIYKDILKTNFKEIVKDYKYKHLYIIGNLPYYITTPILEHIINSSINPSKMIFMVQKEVADRLTAVPNHKEYGYMTVYLNHYYDVKKEIFVSKNNFSPKPKVDSQIISLKSKEKIKLDNEQDFFNFIKKCFTHKRKTLKNNLFNYNFELIKTILNDNGYDDNIRAEGLNEETFVKIYNALKK